MAKESYKKHEEKRKQQKREYYQQNKEKIKVKRMEYDESRYIKAI